MKWKVFCAGTPYLAEKPEQGLEILGKEKMGNEVAFTRRVYMTPARAKKFGEIAESCGVPLSVHAPYFVNLANPEKLKASEKRILDSCKCGEKMNAQCVVVHAGYYMGDERGAFERIKKSLKSLVKKTSCPIGIEIMGKVKSFGTIDECLDLSEINGVIPVMDFAHWYARQQGKIDYENVLKKFKDFKHLHTHFSGIRYGPSGERNHLPLDTKKPDFKPLAKLIVKKKLNINIVCECPCPFDDAVKMRDILGKLK